MKITGIFLRRFRFDVSQRTMPTLKLDVEVMYINSPSRLYRHYSVGEAISGSYNIDFIMFCNPFGDL